MYDVSISSNMYIVYDRSTTTSDARNECYHSAISSLVQKLVILKNSDFPQKCYSYSNIYFLKRPLWVQIKIAMCGLISGLNCSRKNPLDLSGNNGLITEWYSISKLVLLGCFIVLLMWKTFLLLILVFRCTC